VIEMTWLSKLKHWIFGDNTVTIHPTNPSPFKPIVIPQTVSWPPTDPATVLAVTIWMEDRSGAKEGMHAVCNVIVNRANNPGWWGTDVVTVCEEKEQFSSWNPGSTQIPLVKKAMENGDENYATALGLAHLALQNDLPDVTMNADSYYSLTLDKPPYWVTGNRTTPPATFTVEIAGQKFYRTELKA